jgi:hypothetical protein
MSTVEEIEAAIRLLSSDERRKLLEDLPALLPELDGDAIWQGIVQDPQARPAFSAFIDQVESEHGRNPEALPEIKEADFERRS